MQLLYYGKIFQIICAVASGLFLIFLLLGISLLFGGVKVRHNDISSYECGFKAIQATLLVNEVQFIRIAVLFLLFDTEILVLLPWALNYSAITLTGHLTAIGFLIILMLGLGYEMLEKVVKYYPKPWKI